MIYNLPKFNSNLSLVKNYLCFRIKQTSADSMLSNTLIIEDLGPEDFTSPECYTIVQTFMKRKNVQIECLKVELKKLKVEARQLHQELGDYNVPNFSTEISDENS